MNGFLLVNKPAGITSYDAIRHIKTCCPKKTKIGHSGTLDPFATGLLIIAIGRDYTRQLNDLLGLDKTYRAEVTLGIETDSYDIDGTITQQYSGDIQLSTAEITACLTQFKGEIQQQPPAFSAKKINGQPAYKLARNGQTVELKPSTVTIYELNLNSDQLSPSNSFNVSVHCSKGTYIRSLAHDIGQSLQVGAHLSQLQRVAIGATHIDDAHELAAITPESISSCLRTELMV
ncbi:MAG: tRNA pseudouridine(55) synthase TruB [Candidatus Marinamargulisbacteria bacterium]